jgi:hypothetical protein
LRFLLPIFDAEQSKKFKGSSVIVLVFNEVMRKKRHKKAIDTF